jgi:hypothetical protein
MQIDIVFLFFKFIFLASWFLIFFGLSQSYNLDRSFDGLNQIDSPFYSLSY